MNKLSGIAFSAILVATILAALLPVMPVSATTWDPNLGWDFQCHTNTHPWLDQLTDAEIRAEYEAVNAAFIAHGYTTPTQTAYPGGRLDHKGRVKAVTAEYRMSGRVVWGYMSTYPITDWYELRAAQLKAKTSFNTIKGWIDECIATNALLVILTHDVTANPTPYGCTPERLTQAVDYAVQKQNAGQLSVWTMSQAYDYWSTAPSGKAVCVFSFDDNWATDYTAVYPIFKARGVKGTSYTITGMVGDVDRLTWAQIDIMRSGA
jgi:peptidoglycan/xylan/chitin deacetylase (PgdA/CDA1 family)